MADYPLLAQIAHSEFADIVVATRFDGNQLRIVLSDSSYIDFWWSMRLPGRFAQHWERRHVDGTIYRHDNAPHSKWKHLSSFPQHFHHKIDSTVVASDLSTKPEATLRQFLQFARETSTAKS